MMWLAVWVIVSLFCLFIFCVWQHVSHLEEVAGRIDIGNECENPCPEIFEDLRQRREARTNVIASNELHTRDGRDS